MNTIIILNTIRLQLDLFLIVLIVSALPPLGDRFYRIAQE